MTTMSIEKLLEVHSEQDRKNFEKIDERLERIETTLNKQAGFVGGVVFVITAIFAVIGTVILYLKG